VDNRPVHRRAAAVDRLWTAHVGCPQVRRLPTGLDQIGRRQTTQKRGLAKPPKNIDSSTPFEMPAGRTQTGSITPIIPGAITPIGDMPGPVATVQNLDLTLSSCNEISFNRHYSGSLALYPQQNSIVINLMSASVLTEKPAAYSITATSRR